MERGLQTSSPHTFAFRQEAAQMTMARQQFRDRVRRRHENQEQNAQDAAELSDLAQMVLQAAQEAIEQLTAQLDRYDVAVIEALDVNQLAIDNAADRSDRMLTLAHTLDDGRRVFKTKDGARVFDEHGTQLSEDMILPDEVADERPNWESFQGVVDEKAKFMQQREDILDYQQRLDDARSDLSSGALSDDDVRSMAEELDAIMPDAVRARLPNDPASSAELKTPSMTTPQTPSEVTISRHPMPSFGL